MTNKNIITKAEPDNIPEYYRLYVDLAFHADLIEALTATMDDTLKLISMLPAEKENYRYYENKWSIKEVFVHLIDIERIFQYRATRFSRYDNTEIEGFEQNDYASNSGAASRKMKNILDEYKAVRISSIELFNNMTETQLDYEGKANNVIITPRILGWIIAGHNIHHCNVIREKYL